QKRLVFSWDGRGNTQHVTLRLDFGKRRRSMGQDVLEPVSQPASVDRQAVRQRHQAAKLLLGVSRVAHDCRTKGEECFAATAKLAGMPAGQPFRMGKQQGVVDESGDRRSCQASLCEQVAGIFAKPKRSRHEQAISVAEARWLEANSLFP